MTAAARFHRLLSARRWLAPAGLLLLCALSFGPLIFTLGLYWDDWPSLWFLHFFGPGVFPQAFAADRPVQGWLFVLTTGLVGESLARLAGLRHPHPLADRHRPGLAAGLALASAQSRRCCV